MILQNATAGLLLQTMLYLSNSSKQVVDPLDNIQTAPNEVTETKCYGVYGCFPIDGPWQSPTRQINHAPQKPSQIRARYPVFNRFHREMPKFIDLNDPDGVQSLGINPNGSLFIVTHGYLESGDKPWIKELAMTLLDADKEGTASVVVVDWGGGSSPPYVQAVANIRLVGAITAHVVFLLYEELQFPNLDKVHMIGHSLGSHLSGYTGYTLQKDFGLKMGRITGLDPAEPLFGDTDPIVRLDKTDAHYVDVIHTDSHSLINGGLGMLKPIGHVDFYPNGGHDNPGCGLRFEEYMKQPKSSFFWSVQQFVSCNHIRSYEFFTESIKPNCPFMGITCDSFESFQEGKCSRCGHDGHMCIQFGYNSLKSYRYLVQNAEVRDTAPLVAYLMTSEKSPFCRAHYKVTIKMSAEDESAMHGGEIGIFSLKIHSVEKNETSMIPFSKEPKYFEPGFQYSAMLPGESVGKIDHLSVTWDYRTNFMNPFTWRLLASPRVYVEYVEVQSLENDLHKIKACSIFASPILSGTPSILREEYCHPW